MRLASVLLLALTLSACNSGDAPKNSTSHAEQGVYSAALSQSGGELVIGSINHGGSFWTTADSERRYNWNHRENDFSQITAIRFSEDQQHVVTAGPQSLVLWNANDGSGDALWSTYSEVLDIAVLAGADYALLALADHSAKLFDLRRGGTLRVFNHDQRVNAVDVYSPANLVATGSDDNAVKLWPLWPDQQVGRAGSAAIEPLTELAHSEPVQIVRFSPDGSKLFTMAQYDGARIWNVDDFSLLGELPIGNYAKRRGALIQSARFSADGKQLLTGSTDREVNLWSVENQRLLRTWKMPKRRGMDPQGTAVLDVAFNASSGYSAVTSDGMVHQLR